VNTVNQYNGIPAAGPYLETVESSPPHHILFLLSFILIPSMPRSPKWSLHKMLRRIITKIVKKKLSVQKENKFNRVISVS
jgi:hypothetical protein